MKKLGLLTVAEAADYLNVPRPTLYQHLREGHIPGIQIGGRWRIELDKLNDFVGKAKRGTDEESTADYTMRTPLSNTGGDRFSTYGGSDVEPNDLEKLRGENSRLRALVADQMLEIQELRQRQVTDRHVGMSNLQPH